MKISGVLIIRNGVRLGYPFELAINSLKPLCDEIVVLVDPTSEDDTRQRVAALNVEVVESVWNMNNHDGHNNCEISVQTRIAVGATTGDWIFSLQADEVLHEDEIPAIRAAIATAEEAGITGIEMERVYFYGDLDTIRLDWTLWMVRLFKRGCWKPDVDGAMRFDPIGNQMWLRRPEAKIYHYSRIGDPQLIAERVRTLDLLFHDPATVREGVLPPYDFTTRKLDTYVIDHVPENVVPVLAPFDVTKHPAGVLERFK